MKSVFRHFNRFTSLTRSHLSSNLLKYTSLPVLTLSAACCATTTEQITISDDDMHSMVSKYYGETLQSSKDLKTSACTASSAPHQTVKDIIKIIPSEVNDKFYGCGNPIPFGIRGLNILDLGSGSGRDCYVASSLVGEDGYVIGIDMTDEQLETARNNADLYCQKTLGYSRTNMDFRKGYIEMLEDPEGANISKESIDIVISNCVVNLSPRKDQVIQGVYNVLKEGGEFYFSDVYCDRRLPQNIREHEVLVGECIGGALYTEDFRRICADVGFKDIRILECTEMAITDPELKDMLGNARFYSITYRLFKNKEIEDRCEDYGQVAIYKGTIPEHKNFYELDDHHKFYANKPMLVCRNTAEMVGNSWLGKHFQIMGDTSTHYGLFDCSPVSVSNNNDTPAVACDTGTSCC